MSLDSDNTSPVKDDCPASSASVSDPQTDDSESNKTSSEALEYISLSGDIDPKTEDELRKKARKLLSIASKLYEKRKKHLSEKTNTEVLDAINSLKYALNSFDASCKPEYERLESVTKKYLKKSGARDVGESILVALIFALVLRTFFVEPYKIPTRSMVPTLLEGDQLFVTKLSYGIRLPILNDYVVHFSDPQRGDVIVFAFPNDEAAAYLARTNSGCMQIESLSEEKDYIKRIIGVEGDTVEVIDQIIHVNGEPVSQQPYYERTVADYLFLSDSRREFWNHEVQGDVVHTSITHQLPSNHFGPIKVQPGHVFVMGDNRDNSADSRCWGQVPISNIKGRAQILWWSSGHFAPRWERMFTKIY